MRTRYHYRDGVLERIELLFDDARRSGDPSGLITPGSGVRFSPVLPASPQPSDVAAGTPAAMAPEDADTASAEASEHPAESASAAEPPPTFEAAAPASVPRGTASRIRGMWAGVFGVTASAGAEGIAYAVNNLTTVDIPPGLGLVLGSLLTGALTGAQYATKKYAKPDGKW